MKTDKEKTQPEKEIERLKNKPLSDDLKKVISNKQRYVNRDIRK